MNDNSLIIKDNTKIITNNFFGFEQYLEAFGLPLDNVIAPFEERQRIMQALPDFLNQLPQEMKCDARYLSKFIAGSAVGLFDAALNFVWNEVVLNLRKKVIAYGLDYFYDSAIGGTFRDQYKDENDLPLVKDQVLLDTCRKLELVSDILHRKLCHILDMRNQIGSSHPNEYAINAYELLGWLQCCIQDVFMDKISDAALTVKSIIDNSKRIATALDVEYLNQFTNSVKDLSPTMVSNLLTSLFGIFVSPDNKDKTIQRQNVLALSSIAWEYSTEKTKYSLGEKIDSYRANLDEYKTQQAELFFEKCHGQRYYSKDAKTIKLTLLCEQLENAHYGWDNYANETPIARDIMQFISSISDVPEIRIESLIKVFLLCRIGNDRYYNEGISIAASRYYDKFFSMVDEKAALLVLNFLRSSENRNLLVGNYRPNHVKNICRIMKSDLLSERCNAMLDFIAGFKGKMDLVFSLKDFKEMTNGKL